MQANSDSGIREIFGSGIRNKAQGIWNPTYDWNPEYKFPLTCPKTGVHYLIQNPTMSWIPFTIYIGRDLHREK